MKNVKFIYTVVLSFLLATTGFLSGCSEWTDPTPVDQQTIGLDEQNLEVYARYLASLKAYKSSIHQVTYVRLDNAPDVPTNGKNYLLALPDSLDFIALRRSDNPSKFDINDMKVTQKKGTRIIYYIDYTEVYAKLSAKGNFIDGLGSYLSNVLSTFNALQFDGFSIAYSGDPEGAEGLWVEAQKTIFAKLFPVVKDGGKVLLFEGNPIHLLPEYLQSVDYFLLNTAMIDNVNDLKSQVIYTNEFVKIPLNKIIITAIPIPLNGDDGGILTDEQNIKQPAITELARRVLSLGPLVGLGIYNIGDDYYHSEMNYKHTREAIQIMNPSPVN